MNNGTIDYAYELYIAAPAEKVWKGLIDGELTKRYVYGTRLESTLKPGAPYAYLGDGNFKVVDGRTLKIAGWPLMLSSLKSLLETGSPIVAEQT
jgi:uncharacterized protein YndB with AHSA1/START domain